MVHADTACNFHSRMGVPFIPQVYTEESSFIIESPIVTKRNFIETGYFDNRRAFEIELKTMAGSLRLSPGYGCSGYKMMGSARVKGSGESPFIKESGFCRIEQNTF